MLLKDVKWEKPVTISLENGAPRIFNGVYEAFDFLQHEWPQRGDKAHEQALRLCRASLMGTWLERLRAPPSLPQAGRRNASGGRKQGGRSG